MVFPGRRTLLIKKTAHLQRKNELDFTYSVKFKETKKIYANSHRNSHPGKKRYP